MSKKSDAVLASLLSERWHVHSEPAAGTTVSANVGAQKSGVARHNVENLTMTLINLSATAFAVTTAIRDASATGTVLWSLDHNIAAGATKDLVVSNLGLSGLRGNDVFFTQNNAGASVTAKVNASGWSQESA